jgi:outer membrane protein TolC
VTGSIGPRGNATTLGEASNQSGSFDYLEVQVGANLTYELPLRGARGASQQADAQAARARLDLDEFRRQLIVDTIRAVDAVRTANKSVELSTRALELSRSNLDDEEARFRAGRTTIFDVLDRQDELQQAQAALADSLLAERRATARVDQLTGELLDRVGIVMKK